MTSLALDYFSDHLPRKPYHTDDFLYGLRINSAEIAKLARYIQHNPPHATFWFVFDVDRVGAAIDWTDVNAPAPNITVKNQGNGHAHLLYALQTAVRTAPDASISALKYAAAVERGLCRKLRADVNYSGLICKNPLNLHWQVTTWREEVYTLDELADYVDLSHPEARRSDFVYGLGRNCQLFEKTRNWAYKAIRQGYPDFSQWLVAVIQRVEMHNVQLTNPLSLPECACIGRSIARWTYQRMNARAFAQFVADTHTSEIQASRGRKGGLAKGNAYSDKREQALHMLAQGITQKTAAELLGVSPRTLRNWKSGK